MKPTTLARVRTWSDGGKGAITIAPAALTPGWSVTARRRVLHGYGDNVAGRGCAEVATTLEASAEVDDPSAEGLDLAINQAIDACEVAVLRWPVAPITTTINPTDVPCTYCGAATGQPCRSTPNPYQSVMMSGYHGVRWARLQRSGWGG